MDHWTTLHPTATDGRRLLAGQHDIRTPQLEEYRVRSLSELLKIEQAGREIYAECHPAAKGGELVLRFRASRRHRHGARIFVNPRLVGYLTTIAGQTKFLTWGPRAWKALQQDLASYKSSGPLGGVATSTDFGE